MGVRVLIVIRCFFVVFGLAGNFLALSAFGISRKMRHPSNLFVASLTVADIIYLLFDVFMIATEIYGSRFFGSAVCTLTGSLALFVPQLFNDSIVAISVVRYINIVHMTNAKVWLTWKYCLMALGVLIIHSLVSPIATWTGWTRLFYLDVIQACSIDWFYDIPATVVALVLNGIAVPNVIILYCYARIYLTYRNSKKRVAAHRDGAQSDAKVKRELQLTMQIVVIYVVFITTSLLLAGMTLFIDPKTPHHPLADLALMMLTVSTAINPPVYFYFNKALRQELVQYFSKCCCRRCRSNVRGREGTLNTATASLPSQSVSQDSAPQTVKSKNSKKV